MRKRVTLSKTTTRSLSTILARHKRMMGKNCKCDMCTFATKVLTKRYYKDGI